MNCELCGREAELYSTLVESIELGVCKDCTRFGKVIGRIADDANEIIEPRKIEMPRTIVEKEVIVENYAGLIKNAREKKQMTQEEVANAIAEKESIIHKIESGQIMPQIKVAKKFEQFFRIKLIVDYKADGNEGFNINFKDNTITIGDLVKIKRKK